MPATTDASAKGEKGIQEGVPFDETAHGVACGQGDEDCAQAAEEEPALKAGAKGDEVAEGQAPGRWVQAVAAVGGGDAHASSRIPSRRCLSSSSARDGLAWPRLSFMT